MARRSGSVGDLGGRPPRSTRPKENPSMNRETIAAGLVARNTVFSGRPNRFLANLISSKRHESAPAGTDRIRGFCPEPTVKASFQVTRLSSRAMQSTGD